MDRESLEKIRQMTKDKITVSNFQNSDFMKEEKNNTIANMKKIAVVCLLVVLGSGIIFQNDIKAFVKYHFGSELVDMAAENGYVEDVDMDSIDSQTTLNHDKSGTVIDNVDVSVKVDEFLMDDINISTNFSFKFDDKIKDFLNLDNVQFIFLYDLVIFDEENRILGCDIYSEENFERICKENNLDYDYDEFTLNDNPRRSGGIVDRKIEENLFKFSLNFEAISKYFPASKELNFAFTKIKLEKYEDYTGQDINNGEYLKSNSVILTGDWRINVKVPEKMYNRPRSEYKAVSISNPDITISSAIASETGFRFNAIIKDPKPINVEDFLYWKDLETLFKARDSGEITEEEYNQKNNELTQSEEYDIAYKKFSRENEIVTTDYWNFADDEEKSIDKITHVTNSKGKKFDATNSSGRQKIISTDKYVWEFFGKCEMTQKDITDKLTVTLIYYGEPVEIVLEKIK